jgi:anti-sigma B factor antagonist
MSNAFEAKVRQENGTAVIDLLGEINATAETALNTAYRQAEQGSSVAILLNFQGVDYMNSTGIALVVGLLAQARKSHRRLVVCGLSEHYQEIFRITRLSDFMQIYSDEISALAG